MTRKKPCPDCGNGGRYDKEKYCGPCALKRGFQRCSACNKIFKPNARIKTITRCAECVLSKRRASSGRNNKSVRTISAGLPGLGKPK